VGDKLAGADQLFDGRPFRILMVVDCHTRESLAIVPRVGFWAYQVVEALYEIAVRQCSDDPKRDCRDGNVDNTVSTCFAKAQPSPSVSSNCDRNTAPSEATALNPPRRCAWAPILDAA
jgi:hypothetical protein